MVDQQFPNSISFENEKGCIIGQNVSYEWKPTICENFHGIGHVLEHCTQRQRKKKQVWVEKSTPLIDDDGFQKISKGHIQKTQAIVPVSTRNSFELLKEDVDHCLESVGKEGEDSIMEPRHKVENEDEEHQEGEPPNSHG